MDELENQVVEILAEEHQSWVAAIQDAEKTGEGIDVNLGGGFAQRTKKLLQAFREFKQRMRKTKKGWFG